MLIWKLQEFGGRFTSVKQNMRNNIFLNAFIKDHRNSIPIILTGFSLLTNQRFVTHNWTPHIFVIFSAVSAVNSKLGIKFQEFRKLTVSQ